MTDRVTTEDLRLELQRIQERLGPDPDAAPIPGFPKVVYRLQETPDPKQIDHPGWDAKTVIDPAALERAKADGWQETVGPYVYAEVEEQVVVTKRVVKSKK